VAVVGRLEVFEQPATLSPKASHKIFDIIQLKVMRLPFTLRQYRLWGKRKERTTDRDISLPPNYILRGATHRT
jgi:hypothetical protein